MHCLIALNPVVDIFAIGLRSNPHSFLATFMNSLLGFWLFPLDAAISSYRWTMARLMWLSNSYGHQTCLHIWKQHWHWHEQLLDHFWTDNCQSCMVGRTDLQHHGRLMSGTKLQPGNLLLLAAVESSAATFPPPSHLTRTSPHPPAQSHQTPRSSPCHIDHPPHRRANGRS